MIKFKPQTRVGAFADMLMMPIMYLLQGNFSELPQRTHRWNNRHLKNLDITDLHIEKMAVAMGVPGAHERWLGPIPLFHMPVFGGWRKFVVLEPVEKTDIWFVGWVAFDALGVSKIPLKNSVRLGVGPRQAEFFGVDRNGQQIAIRVVGEGSIGEAGKYARVPLL